MKMADTKKVKNEQRSVLSRWDNEGGAVASNRGQKAETQQEEDRERAARRAAFDTTHDSSARGEHRYPDAHQTDAEQKARRERDSLKRRLGRTR
jgi:hypothetical protein